MCAVCCKPGPILIRWPFSPPTARAAVLKDSHRCSAAEHWTQWSTAPQVCDLVFGPWELLLSSGQCWQLPQRGWIAHLIIWPYSVLELLVCGMKHVVRVVCLCVSLSLSLSLSLSRCRSVPVSRRACSLLRVSLLGLGLCRVRIPRRSLTSALSCLRLRLCFVLCLCYSFTFFIGVFSIFIVFSTQIAETFAHAKRVRQMPWS